MEKILLLLLFFVTSFRLSFGQVTKESYEFAVDILNYKSVYYSLSVLSPTNGVTIKFKQSCNCENSPNFHKIQSSIPKSESKTLELSSKIEELKSQNVSEFNKSHALDFLLNKVFEQSELLSNFKSDLNKKGTVYFGEYTASLKQQLEVALKEKLLVNIPNQSESESDFAELENRMQLSEKSLNLLKKKSGFLGVLSDFLIVLSLVLILLSFFITFRNRNSYEDVLNGILESRRLKDMIHIQSNLAYSSTRPNDSILFEIRDMQGRIRDLESQIERLKNETKIFKQPASNSLINNEISSTESITGIFFFSTPNSDGSFNESSASNFYKEGASIYKFFKTGTTKAQFQVDERETSIKLALQYPDKNIDPVCDAQNAFNPRANRILIKKMGEAELQNGKWIINSKAVICYEN